LLFILKSNLTQPIRQITEQHVSGPVRRIELANQVSFLNKASLESALRSIPENGNAILDARNTDYIDPDVHEFIREFKEITAPAHGIRLQLQGFRERYQMSDEVQFVDFSPRESSSELTPAAVLKILTDGNDRFCSGKGLDRNLQNFVHAESRKLQPLAVVFSGVDGRVPAELIFDLSLGELVTVRLAGNVIGPRVLGSIEFGCLVGGAKLIVIMGHRNSGMVSLAIKEAVHSKSDKNSSSNLSGILSEIQQSIEPRELEVLRTGGESAWDGLVDAISHRNVKHTAQQILAQSSTIRELVDKNKVALMGAFFDSTNGRIEMFEPKP
jgi:carbonic anhydrase